MVRQLLGFVTCVWLVSASTVAEGRVAGDSNSLAPRLAEVLEKLEAVRGADVSDELKERARLAVHQVLKTQLSLGLKGVRPLHLARTRGTASKAYALVIGNGNYEHLPSLETAVADAEAVADVLARRYGFEVTLLREGTRYRILAALNGLRATVGPADDLLIFYSGHSEQPPSHDGTGYWLPVDAIGDDPASWISTRSLGDILGSLPARHAMIVADAAYGGLLAPTALGMPFAGPSRTVLSSGGVAPELAADAGARSAFSQALLEALEAADTPMRGRELEREVATRMAAMTAGFALAPNFRYGPVPHAGHGGGDFVLVPSSRPGQVRAATEGADKPASGADDFLIVDCRVPRPRQLTRVQYPTSPRPVRTSMLDCERRGGQFVAHSALDPATALQVWLESAEAGDPQAQTHVGEAFERGANGAPDFAAAARWYRRAAEQDFAAAQINLGHLYERGLGVPRDEAVALDWYRRAAWSGSEVALASMEVQVASNMPPGEVLDERELGRLQREIARLEKRVEGAASLDSVEPDVPVITVIDPSLSAEHEVVPVHRGVERRQVIGRVDAPAGLLSLTVNDWPLSPDEFQMFRAEVSVPAAGTTVSVVAIDRRGGRAEFSFVLRPAAAVADNPPLPAASPGDELKAFAQAVGQERPDFARPAFQCLDDLDQCGRAGFAWLDCQLTMLVCVFDLALP